MKELNKKLAEWAKDRDSCDTAGHHYYIIGGDKFYDWEIEEGLFTNSLDTCFEYLVPKAIGVLNKNFNWDEKGCLNRIFKDWQRMYWNGKGVLSYALALCKAIEKLIDARKSGE